MSSANTSSVIMLLVNINKFLYYFRPILFIIGMIGSCLDVLLFSRRRFRTVSCCTYFLAAAVAIIIQSIITFGVTFYGYDHVNPTTSIVAICKIYFYIQQSTAMVQRWLMAAASFDRYACMSGEAGLRRFATVHVARRVVLGIVVIWLVITVFRLVFYTVKANACGIFGNDVAALIHSIYTAVAGTVIPPLIMIPSLLLIQRNLARRRQRRHHMVIQQKERNEAEEVERKRDQQVLAILLVQLILYFILITPLMCIMVYNAITLHISNKSVDRLIIEQSLFNIGDMLAAIYSAIPFYVNTITSRMFREELMIVVRNVVCCRWLPNTNRVDPLFNNNAVKTPAAGHQRIRMSALKADLEQAIMGQNMAQ